MGRAAAKALARGAAFTLTAGPCAGLVHNAKVEKITVGRTRTSKFQIKDASISEKHAELYLEGETWYVRDVGSTNGSLLNGKSIDDIGVPIQTGDIIRFGNDSTVEVQVQELQEQQAEPSGTAAASQPAPLAAASSAAAGATAAAPVAGKVTGSTAAPCAAAEAAPPAASEPAVAPLPQLEPMPLTAPLDCAGLTLEQYVRQESNRIASSIQAHAEAQVHKLRQDWAAKKASWQGLLG